MSTHQELLERMHSANPVPHPDQTDPDELGVVFSLLTERRAAMTAAPERQLDRQHRKLEPPHHPPRRLVLAFAASAAIMLAAVGLTAILLRGDESEPAAPPPTSVPEVTASPVTGPPTTVPPETASAATQAPVTQAPAPEPQPTSVTQLVWSRVPHDIAVFGDGTDYISISDLAFGHGLWIAVGRAAEVLGPDSSFVDRGLVLLSSDGVNWERVAGHEDLDYGEAPWLDGGPTMNAVSVTDDGFVIVGRRFMAVTDEGARGAEAAVWRSADGRNWTAVPWDGEVFGGRTDPAASPSDGAEMRDVVAVGNTVIAVGDYANAAAVWVSHDAGATWTRLPHSDSVFGARDLPGEQDDQDFEAMNAITVGPDGFVAVGLDIDVDRTELDRVAAVWRSPNGVEWQRLPDADAVFSGEGLPAVRDVVATGTGYVAVGFEAYVQAAEPGEHAAAWFSPDGIAWERVEHDDMVFGAFEERITMSAVAAGPGGLVAVGSGEPGAVQQGMVWTSYDGLAWQRVPGGRVFVGADAAMMLGVAPTADGFIIVGAEATESGSYGAIWTGVPE